MSGTNQNSYPQCIKCGGELNSNSGDARGWEKISFPSGEGINLISKDIWLCPNCIVKFQHVKDLLKLKENKSEEEKNIWRTLADLKYLLDKADRLDSPINDYNN